MPPPRNHPRRPAPAGLPVTRLAWWSAVVLTGVLTVVAFEAGGALGRRVAARRARAAETSAEPAPRPAPAVPTAKHPEPHNRTPAPAAPTAKNAEPKAVAKTVEPKPAAKATEPKAAPESVPVADVRFETGVLPVFQAKCNSCHGALSKRGGLDLRTLAAATRGGNSGPGVVPGRPGDSPVWESVRTGQMPPANKPQLTPAEKQLILAWVAGGAR